MRKPVHNMKGCTLIIQRMKPLVRLVSSADIDLVEHMMAAGGKPHLPIETSLKSKPKSLLTEHSQ